MYTFQHRRLRNLVSETLKSTAEIRTISSLSNTINWPVIQILTNQVPEQHFPDLISFAVVDLKTTALCNTLFSIFIAVLSPLDLSLCNPLVLLGLNIELYWNMLEQTDYYTLSSCLLIKLYLQLNDMQLVTLIKRWRKKSTGLVFCF